MVSICLFGRSVHQLVQCEPKYERKQGSTINGHILESIKDVLKNKQMLIILIGVAIIIPVVGYWSDLFSINTAFLLSGLIVLFISTGFFTFLKKN